MEGFLQLKISPWLRMLLTRSVALVPAIMVAVLTEQDSDGSDLLDEWLNVLQSVQLPFALLPVLHFTSSKGIMGNAFVNGPTTRVLMWMIALLVIITNVLLTIGFLADDDKPVPHTWWFVVVAVTTVGFGDVVPESEVGKLFVAVLLGVGLRGSYSACILLFACIHCTN